DAHKEDDLEFKIFPKHCIDGTKGAEIIEELRPKSEDIIVKKTRYSGFYNTNLSQILKENKVSEVELVGVCTSICVMDTAGELRNRDYKVIVYKDGVADFDPKAHSFALERMEKIYGCKVQ
ncbi:MAG: isochorismatase family cysteine hydrolase, partial [Elusimicrobiota bacterium]|nr:isochorismatase family cysteine hydrolase [Elusimicrobiota bacterium]